MSTAKETHLDGPRERKRDLYRLVAATLILAGFWGFLALAGQVTDGSTLSYDEFLLQALRQSDDPGLIRGPGWLMQATRDITALGGVTVVTGVVVAVAGMLLLVRRYRTTVLVLIAGFGAMGVNEVLKLLFGRERPTLVPHLMEVHSLSFPSGHAMTSAAVYLSLGLLLANTRSTRREKAYILAIAALVPLLVGFTRVYLGVHYPSDVVAGWLAGMIWALACGFVARELERRTDYDPEREAEQADARAAAAA